jgi:hypothetical protein
MPARRVSVLLALTLLLVLVASIVSAQDSAPSNDNLADAIPLVLNAAYITDGNLALASVETEETSDPDLTTCGTFSASVWYEFTAPFTGTVAISTINSLIYLDGGNSHSRDTSLAIYTGDSYDTLTEVACALGGSLTLAELDGFGIGAGAHYFIRVGTPIIANQISGGALGLETSVRHVTDALPADFVNLAFDQDLSEGWKLSNATNGDGIEAGKMVFKGSKNEATKLVQKAPWRSDQMLGRRGHLLEMYLSDTFFTGAPNLKIAMIVKYSDGMARTKVARTITQIKLNGSYSLALALEGANVQNIKIVMLNRGAKDSSVSIEEIRLDYDGALLREVLPLPGF